MKNLLLLILFCLSHLINAQVVFKGVSPSSVSGISFDFEWAEPTGTWSTTIPDFNLQNTFVQDTLELVVDNSWTGNNPAYTIPHPLANEGCLDANGGAHSQPSLAGKIAVVWRGSCQFSLKAALAENNGAVAIVIINHSGAPVGMAGGDSGLFINIPVVMISNTDGQLLLSEMANGPVEVFIGNKIGSSVNDLGSSKDVSNISKYGSVPTSFVQNGNNNFDLGLTITNYGSDDNIPVLNQTITGPSGYSYDTTITYGLLPAAQDTDYTYIPYTETNLAIGNYTLNYNLSILNETDQDSSDNNIISSFSVTNDVLSRARTDQSTGEIIANFYPSNYTFAMSSCMHLYEENYPVSSFADGVYFSVGTDSTPLSSEYFNVSIYEWNDIQSGGWALDYTLNQLTPVLINDYFFANDSLSEKIVYHEFDDGNGQPAPFQFLDFQRYLVCIEYQNGTALDIAFGYDNYLDYESNSVYNPDFGSGRLNIDGISPFNGTQGDWYPGWGSADAPSIGLKFGCNQLTTINETFCGSYNFNGIILNSPGTYYDSFQTSSGCDSNVVLNLSTSVFYGDANITACSSYTWIDGNTYTSSIDSVSYTVQTAAGCDSIYNLNLTILPNQFGTDFTANQLLFTSLPFVAQFTNNTPNPTNYNFTWDFGDGTVLQSNNANVFHDFLYNGLYSVTLIAQDINTGCTDTMYKQDYIYTTGSSCINAGVDIQNACGSYSWIDGITYTSSNNTATDTLTNASGCDSIVTLNLTINQTSSSIDNQTLCDGNTLNWIDGNTYTSSNNTATYTLTNTDGCDSIVSLNLTVSSSTSTLVAISSCNSYIFNGQSYTSSGIYVSTNLNAAGCPQIDSLDLTITTVGTTTVQSSCDSFLWNGTTYDTSGIYTSNSSGNCVDTLVLTISEFLTNFTASPTLITSPPFNVTFNNTTPNISNYDFTWDFGDGTIGQTNIPSFNYQYMSNGIYDVSLIAEDITNNCGYDTLKFDNLISCSGGSGTSINEKQQLVNIYPNPTNENITISIENFNGNIQTEVYDLIGNRLQTTNETTISLEDYARGIYLLKITYGDKLKEVKVIKE